MARLRIYTSFIGVALFTLKAFDLFCSVRCKTFTAQFFKFVLNKENYHTELRLMKVQGADVSR